MAPDDESQNENDDDDQGVGRLLVELSARGWTLAAAESDTGGLLLAWLVARPGSSRVVLGGVVAYHDRLKHALLGVPPELLAGHGAVSAAVAQAMAEGIRLATGADLGLATTGIAGPGGATANKPVGLAFVAAASPARRLVREHRWQGDRGANRRASARAALALAVETLS